MAYNPERNIIYVGTNKEDLLMVKINEHSDKDMCEVVGTFKRKNYTRCTQITIEYNKMFILSISVVIQLIRRWRFMSCYRSKS